MIKVHLGATQEFVKANRESKGELKKRAMKVLRAQLKDEADAVLSEVSDPQLADACFRILLADGRWKIGKVRNSGE